MAEHSAVNRRVVGSSPTWGAKSIFSELRVPDRAWVRIFSFLHDDCAPNVRRSMAPSPWSKKSKEKLAAGTFSPCRCCFTPPVSPANPPPVPFPAVQSMPQPPSSLLRSYRKDDRAKGFGSGCQCSVFCETNTVYLTIPMLCPVSETMEKP